MILCDTCSPRKQCTADKNRTECKYYQPMTNEEWLRQANTEQLAEWIATQCSNAVMENTYDVSKLRKKRYWEEWLKEKLNHETN